MHEEKLGETIASAARFSGKHPTLPVLSALLCEAKQNTLLIRATNLDIGIEITIPVKVLQRFRCDSCTNNHTNNIRNSRKTSVMGRKRREHSSLLRII